MQKIATAPTYILTEEEYRSLAIPGEVLGVLHDLRTKVLELAKFKCYHDLTEQERRAAWVDDGYCDSCPLSFCENEDKKTKHEMCPHNNDGVLYSK